MRTILFTNARDENNIEEWVVHHQLLGFDTIYVTDHLSGEGIRGRLGAFEGVIVEEFAQPVRAGLKNEFIRKAVRYAQAQAYDWMLYLDADEFLFLRNHATVADFLAGFAAVSEIGINWLMFGSPEYDAQPPGLIMNNFLHCAPAVNPQVKAFVRPTEVTGVNLPHNYEIKTSTLMCDANGRPMAVSPYNHRLTSHKLYSAYIAHYYEQSYQTYHQRKVVLPRDDSATFRPCKSKEEFFLTYKTYILEPELRDKYATPVLATLKQLCPERSHYF